MHVCMHTHGQRDWSEPDRTGTVANMYTHAERDWYIPGDRLLMYMQAGTFAYMHKGIRIDQGIDTPPYTCTHAYLHMHKGIKE